MKKILLAISLLSVVTGCSKLQQDPLGDRPEIIQDSKPIGEKPDPQKPIDDLSLVIDGPESYSFMEERVDHIEYVVRTLDPDYTGQLEIANLNLFPGATFDPIKGSFSWIPPKGFATSNPNREIELKVKATAVSRSGQRTVFVRTKTVHLLINHKTLIPELKSVSTFAVNIREGSSAKVTVVVVDPDGGLNPGEAPSLLFLPPTTASRASKSLAPFAVVNAVDVDFPSRRWTFDVRINLNNTELTTSGAIGGLVFKAVNRFNQSTAEVPFTIKIYTQLTDLISSWATTDIPEITVGTETTIPFLIFDPRGEALVDAWTTFTPAGSSLRCQASRVGLTSCLLKWTAPDNMGGTQQSIYISAKGTNTDSSDTQSLAKTFTYYVNVKAKPIPAPIPAPAPSPTPLPTPTPGPTMTSAHAEGVR